MQIHNDENLNLIEKKAFYILMLELLAYAFVVSFKNRSSA